MLNYLKSAVQYYNTMIEICQVPGARISGNLENFKVSVVDYWREKGLESICSPAPHGFAGCWGMCESGHSRPMIHTHRPARRTVTTTKARI
jgi:hypothetical protein